MSDMIYDEYNPREEDIILDWDDEETRHKNLVSQVNIMIKDYSNGKKIMQYAKIIADENLILYCQDKKSTNLEKFNAYKNLVKIIGFNTFGIKPKKYVKDESKSEYLNCVLEILDFEDVYKESKFTNISDKNWSKVENFYNKKVSELEK